MDYYDNLGYLINKAARMTKWDLNNALTDVGITSAQWGLIRDIFLTESICNNEAERLCKLTPAAIAERMHADRPTISCMVEKLVKQDFAYRVSNPNDRRSQIILLTDKAKVLIPKLMQLAEDTLEKATTGFSEEDTKQLKEYLSKVIENLM
ncbi:MAG: transcriptional regulator [Clostridia bacterium]|jgi:DNA-binding MarR family transcriptional regulator|nr:transcriptional regulator [Clostridia bacterium]